MRHNEQVAAEIREECLRAHVRRLETKVDFGSRLGIFSSYDASYAVKNLGDAPCAREAFSYVRRVREIVKR